MAASEPWDEEKEGVGEVGALDEARWSHLQPPG